MTAGERRSARLLFAAELRDGRVGEEELDRPEVAAAVAERRVPSVPARLLQRVLMKRGRLSWEGESLAPMLRARRAVLGDAAAGPPRLVVRVDEFPHYRAADDPDRYGLDAYRRFHAIMRGAGVPYLVAVVPRLAHRPLDPEAVGGRALSADEVAMLAELRRDGTELAVHGLDHRTRHAKVRRQSELLGRDADDLRALLDDAEATLAAHAVRPRVFVAPYNRFGRGQYGELARRWDVVCGGPETVTQLGFHPTPLWRGEAVYLPSYPPLYARSGAVLPAAIGLAEQGAAVWAPVTLHWGWEADDGWRDLERLVETIAPWTAPWSEFLEAVDASR